MTARPSCNFPIELRNLRQRPKHCRICRSSEELPAQSTDEGRLGRLTSLLNIPAEHGALLLLRVGADLSTLNPNPESQNLKHVVREGDDSVNTGHGRNERKKEVTERITT